VNIYTGKWRIIKDQHQTERLACWTSRFVAIIAQIESRLILIKH